MTQKEQKKASKNNFIEFFGQVKDMKRSLSL